MGELLFFLSLMAIFLSAFFVIALMSSGKLDRIHYLENRDKDIERGDMATLFVGGKELQCVVEDNFNDEDMTSAVIKLRYLR